MKLFLDTLSIQDISGRIEMFAEDPQGMDDKRFNKFYKTYKCILDKDRRLVSLLDDVIYHLTGDLGGLFIIYAESTIIIEGPKKGPEQYKKNLRFRKQLLASFIHDLSSSLTTDGIPNAPKSEIILFQNLFKYLEKIEGNYLNFHWSHFIDDFQKLYIGDIVDQSFDIVSHYL